MEIQAAQVVFDAFVVFGGGDGRFEPGGEAGVRSFAAGGAYLYRLEGVS